MANYTLAATTSIGSSLRLLQFAETPAGYDTPGQFMAVHGGPHKPAWFAIASSPGEPLELLVKRGGDVADVLCSLEPGAVVTADDPMGKGFAVQERSRAMVCLINGTGISAVRPVVRAELDAGLPRPVHVLYGVHTAEDLAFEAELAAWEAQGVQVVRTVGSGGGPWHGPRGWVQQHAQQLGLVRGDVDLVLCGVRDMATEARALYAAVGLPESQILTNF